jgi:ubiquinone/menaquinone biosynthesis C-methylase UbiE
LFDEVPELYDRLRPTYPDELFADLVSIAGIHQGSSMLEVGCGTGQATRALAALGFAGRRASPANLRIH